ncbi:MAG: DUF4236 domain-containing protein [Spirochaetes bacterium]|nr:DUF4236 domain-containing protein [Spirochaetota bacterium]
MGFGLKKRISLGGGMILNISKRGIFTSGGIKGLRIGVNSRDAYAVGSSYGSYIRKSIGGNTSSPQISENKNGESQTLNYTEEVPENQISGRNPVTALLLISVPIMFFIMLFTSLTLLIFLGYMFAAVFISMIIFARKVKENRKIIKDFSSAIMNEPLKKAEELLPKINKMNRTVRQRILMSNYLSVIDRVFNDQQISEEEEYFIIKYSEHLPENYISQANDIIISEIIKMAIADNFLSEEKENLINRCFSTFKLQPSRRVEFNETIQEYKNLEEYRKNIFEPKPITITSLPQIPSCLYESLAEYLKEREKNGITELIYDDSGAVVLTESSLEIVRTGHKSIKFDSIISANKSWRGDVIEIITTNNKTPYYFKVSDPMIFIAVISKMMLKK